jgi:putative membrane protein
MLMFLIALVSNAAAIVAAEYFVSGFEVTDDPLGFATVVILFTIANSLILPMLRFILKPLIWLTLGLLAIILNGALIYLVDILSENITISGLIPLLLATIVVGVVNAFFALGARAFKK